MTNIVDVIASLVGVWWGAMIAGSLLLRLWCRVSPSRNAYRG